MMLVHVEVGKDCMALPENLSLLRRKRQDWLDMPDYMLCHTKIQRVIFQFGSVISMAADKAIESTVLTLKVAR